MGDSRTRVRVMSAGSAMLAQIRQQFPELFLEAIDQKKIRVESHY
jgi:hypothetical protein